MRRRKPHLLFASYRHPRGKRGGKHRLWPQPKNLAGERTLREREGMEGEEVSWYNVWEIEKVEEKWRPLRQEEEGERWNKRKRGGHAPA